MNLLYKIFGTRLSYVLGLSVAISSYAQTVSKYIVVDQFGYRPSAKKVAVIRDPVMGNDASESFTPGTSYSVVNASNSAKVFTAAPTIWQNGKTDSVAGDKAWWFDFSTVTTAGSYYVLDVQKNVKSYTFEIKEDIYNTVLKHAVRFFFYQRAGFSKKQPYADAGWVDGASHLGPMPTLPLRGVKNIRASSCQVNVMNYQGTVVKKFDTVTNKQELSLQELPSGSYFIKVIQEGNEVVRPFIKL